jgi:predicted lactoylglutathione lyase
MNKMIFVNLPVTDLARSKAFYAALGFVNEPRFTDDTAAAMQWSDSIFVMLLTHAKWTSFTKRPIPDSRTSEVMLALLMGSRDEVNRMTDEAALRGGSADVNPAQDLGFMFSRTFADHDGHVWEPFWMDPAAAAGNA